MDEIIVLNVLDQIPDPVEAVAALRAQCEAALADRAAAADAQEQRLDRLCAAYGERTPSF